MSNQDVSKQIIKLAMLFLESCDKPHNQPTDKQINHVVDAISNRLIGSDVYLSYDRANRSTRIRSE